MRLIYVWREQKISSLCEPNDLHMFLKKTEYHLDIQNKKRLNIHVKPTGQNSESMPEHLQGQMASQDTQTIPMASGKLFSIRHLQPLSKD